MRSAATGAVLPLLRVAARAGEGAAGARGVLVPVSAPAVGVAAPRGLLLLRLGSISLFGLEGRLLFMMYYV